jgi:hypothetical protein
MSAIMAAGRAAAMVAIETPTVSPTSQKRICCNVSSLRMRIVEVRVPASVESAMPQKMSFAGVSPLLLGGSKEKYEREADARARRRQQWAEHRRCDQLERHHCRQNDGKACPGIQAQNMRLAERISKQGLQQKHRCSKAGPGLHRSQQRRQAQAHQNLLVEITGVMGEYRVLQDMGRNWARAGGHMRQPESAW